MNLIDDVEIEWLFWEVKDEVFSLVCFLGEVNGKNGGFGIMKRVFFIFKRFEKDF